MNRQELANTLRKRITSGEFPPGSRFLTLVQIHQQYGAANGTATRALRILVESGVLVTKTGKGTYVRRDANLAPDEEEGPCYRYRFDLDAGGRYAIAVRDKAYLFDKSGRLLAEMDFPHRVVLLTFQRAIRKKWHPIERTWSSPE